MSDDKVQLHTHVSTGLKKKLRAEADDRGVAMRDVVEAALGEYLNPDSYKTVSLEYLARIDRKYSTVLKRADLLVEFVALFARAWFRLHPAPDDEERREALARQGDARFERFADRVEEMLHGDDSFRKGFEDAVAQADDFFHNEE